MYVVMHSAGVCVCVCVSVCVCVCVWAHVLFSLLCQNCTVNCVAKCSQTKSHDIFLSREKELKVYQKSWSL